MGRHSAPEPAVPSDDEPDGQSDDFDSSQSVADFSAFSHTHPGSRRRVSLAVGLVMLGVILLGFGFVSLTMGDDPQNTSQQTNGQDTTAVPLTTSATVATSEPAPPTSPAPPSPAVMPVTVLNNSAVGGLAARVAAELEAGGWPIAELLNYSETQVRATTVFFSPGNAAEEAAAQALITQFPEITGGAKPRFNGLDGSGLTVAAVGDWVP